MGNVKTIINFENHYQSVGNGAKDPRKNAGDTENQKVHSDDSITEN